MRPLYFPRNVSGADDQVVGHVQIKDGDYGQGDNVQDEEPQYDHHLGVLVVKPVGRERVADDELSFDVHQVRADSRRDGAQDGQDPYGNSDAEGYPGGFPSAA